MPGNNVPSSRTFKRSGGLRCGGGGGEKGVKFLNWIQKIKFYVWLR